MTWLLDTLAWTAVLIGLVLMLRHPVSRKFGPQSAYALWLLPFLRLLLPPIVLPAWLAPAQQVAPEPAMVLAPNLVPTGATAIAAPAPMAASLDWLVLVPALWITGAAVLLAWRFTAYFRIRRELLQSAREMGREGRIRLLETPLVDSPLAIGVVDKVIVLPDHFMAMHDRRSRDLALEHELSHHRANDLLANMLIQPLFALHWFNPLGYYGWRAMRRDQEAACDARVIAARGSAERAAYAQLIAAQAAGPRVALAAPMACPVLGDTSIVHRLRNLTMTEISRRRRIAGRLLVATAALALPLTASFSYAEAQVNDPPAPPPAPAAPAAPAAPEAPPAPELVPTPPTPPAPPEVAPAPEAPQAAKVHEVRKIVFVDKDGKRQEWDSKKFDQEMQKMQIELKNHNVDRREIEIQVRQARADAEQARADADQAMREAMADQKVFMADCNGKQQTWTDKDGRKVERICIKQVMASALEGIRQAREEIANDNDMSDSVRKQVLESLDREIARMSAKANAS
ncbi:M56 family metallopeptidase [Tsuneonella mangrovi]|uniref:M56 family metallopeptidase n=1 Tax=Tsuneonella mangrovi TaxID=1982042 RepID=UPI000BA2AB35|nr:M56 family metallopeptidase [Tsuneonella mangrovi]